MICAECGQPVNPNAIGVYREVTGWAKVRRDGGTNAIALKGETGRLMCSACGERKKLNDRWGVVDGQESMI